MFNWFKNEVTSVESILSTWWTTMKALEAHIFTKTEEVVKNNVIIVDATAAALAAQAEVTKAKDIANKIKEIIA